MGRLCNDVVLTTTSVKGAAIAAARDSINFWLWHNVILLTCETIFLPFDKSAYRLGLTSGIPRLQAALPACISKRGNCLTATAPKCYPSSVRFVSITPSRRMTNTQSPFCPAYSLPKSRKNSSSISVRIMALNLQSRNHFLL